MLADVTRSNWIPGDPSSHDARRPRLPASLMTVLALLATTAAISVSGALSPGPVTAVTISHGTRDRHAGARIAIGHATIELPFVIILTAGFAQILESAGVRIGLGLAGGACLIWMGLSLLRSARSARVTSSGAATDRSSVSAGLLLTATNPYFYLWWLSVGMVLVVQASSLGLAAFVLFIVVHWLCDLVWLWMLSALSFKGGNLFGERFQTGTFVVCGLALAGFGVKFVADAVALVAG